MARSGVTALSLALILTMVGSGSCLRCYQCISTLVPSCESLPDPQYLIECHNNYAMIFNQMFLAPILPKAITSGIVGSARYCHKIVLESGTVARTCLDGNAIKVDLTCVMIMGASSLGNLLIPIPKPLRIASCHVCDKNMCNAAGSIAASLPLGLLGLLGLLVSYICIK